MDEQNAPVESTVAVTISTIISQKSVLFSCSNQSKNDVKPQKITARNLTFRILLRFGFQFIVKIKNLPNRCLMHHKVSTFFLQSKVTTTS